MGLGSSGYTYRVDYADHSIDETGVDCRAVEERGL
jgi:hypothetical protein